MHFICIYLLALLHIFEYTKKTELYPAIGKEELFQMLYSQNKKRGFTLVELIVVLVILAILAALLIPALTGYIDKAKKDQVIAETRMLHEAIQTRNGSKFMARIQPGNLLTKLLLPLHLLRTKQSRAAHCCQMPNNVIMRLLNSLS